MPSPRPFTHHVPDADIADLRDRLRRTRWPDEVNDDAWGWGVPLATMRDIVDHWAERFDWRAQEARIFALPNFMLDIDGLDTHFIHARSPHPEAMPIVISHGWPGSVFEFLDLIPRLTHPEQFGGTAADAFHVVAPSLAGYGYSPAARTAGMSAGAIGQRHAALMAALGYDRYIAQGGDWGSFISRLTAEADPAHCIGLHMNMLPPIPPAGVANPMDEVREVEKRYLANYEAYRTTGAGYFHQQGTKPQTLGYALNDSPTGWAAWVVEKFHAWTDNRGDVRDAVALDTLLGNISLYWFTGTIVSATRLYKEFRLAEAAGREQFRRIETPTGVTVYPFDLTGCPRAWAERLFPIVHWHDAPDGGHFAALERPQAFAEDLRVFRKALGK